MKRLIAIVLFAAALAGSVAGQRWEWSDSVDVLNTEIDITFRPSADRVFVGYAEVTLRLLQPCPKVALMLSCTVDSVAVDGVWQRSGSLDSIGTGHLAAGDTVRVAVAYHSTTTTNSDWGGMHVESDMIYNLGVSFTADPHSVGRAWFPTRDNFTDKGTYHLRVTVPSGWRALCGGMPTGAQQHADGSTTSEWHIGLPTPAYLVSVAVGAWNVIERPLQGADSIYNATFGYMHFDSAAIVETFDLLDTVLPAFERAFGPYLWRRIGYCTTPLGSMEHVMNIALAQQVVANEALESRFGNVCHELAHSWFGNTITCAESGDMWINEGGASFCEEVAIEACRGRAFATAYYQKRLDEVLRTAHINDGAYYPLHGVPHSATYGNTTYRKGALVWHTIRGYMGDSLFYATMTRLFDRCRFANFDAYALIDTLEAYSGKQLSAVMDGYVFFPGFWSYHIESVSYSGGQATIRVSRQRIGMLQNVMLHSAVPVVLFDDHFENPVECWVHFNDNLATATCAVPYEPKHWAIDYHQRMANALTATEFDGSTTGLQIDPTTHFALGVLPEAEPTHTYVEHHWGSPRGTMPQGVLRTADRYWVVAGNLPCNETLTGRFYYNRDGYRTGTSPHLDDGFYKRQATLDSMALLYRYNSADEWAIATLHHSADRNEGFFTDLNLRPGEYTLAVVDTNILGLNPVAPTTSALTITPNPTTGHFTVSYGTASHTAPATLTVVDMQGRTVYSHEGFSSGMTIDAPLPAGNYIVKIENKFLSLQSKLIVL